MAVILWTEKVRGRNGQETKWTGTVQTNVLDKLFYADDMAENANTETKMHGAMDRLSHACANYEHTISPKEIEILEVYKPASEKPFSEPNITVRAAKSQNGVRLYTRLEVYKVVVLPNNHMEGPPLAREYFIKIMLPVPSIERKGKSHRTKCCLSQASNGRGNPTEQNIW